MPITKYRAWDFFSHPKNLLLVTPSHFELSIKGHSDVERIYEGQVIKHRVTVLPFVRIDWETEVRDLSYYECFTLRQRKGPYLHWDHTHKFRTLTNGSELIDEVEYALPMGMIGRLTQPILVKPELEKVFNYRAKAIQEYFGSSRIVVPVPEELHSKS